MTATKTEWQRRTKAAGLTQRQLAGLAGLAEETVSRQLRSDGEPSQLLKSLIIAYELMTPKRRAEWLETVFGEPPGGP